MSKSRRENGYRAASAASGLVVGAFASLQNWSGIWRFAWSHTKQGVEAPGSLPMRFFDLHNDPIQRASEYATLALYLRGDMPPLQRETESAEEYEEAALLAGTAGATQFGSAHKGVSPWERRLGPRRCRLVSCSAIWDDLQLFRDFEEVEAKKKGPCRGIARAFRKREHGRCQVTTG
ncbi:MAG: hypothetical protein IJ678_02360, partial [Kiritimatiellae bacterium]|nr:hypothetical protein [Kiritimatiellia bacterium]